MRSVFEIHDNEARFYMHLMIWTLVIGSETDGLIVKSQSKRQSSQP